MPTKNSQWFHAETFEPQFARKRSTAHLDRTLTKEELMLIVGDDLPDEITKQQTTALI